MPSIAYLECSRCGAHTSAETPQTVCQQCPTQPAGSLFVRYDLKHLKGTAARDVIAKDAAGPWAGMWRYRSVLPEAEPVTLGEGWTPMLQSTRHTGAFVKEEGANPTGTFKARGLAMAVTMAGTTDCASSQCLRLAMRRERWQLMPRQRELRRISSCRTMCRLPTMLRRWHTARM